MVVDIEHSPHDMQDRQIVVVVQQRGARCLRARKVSATPLRGPTARSTTSQPSAGLLLSERCAAFLHEVVDIEHSPHRRAQDDHVTRFVGPQYERGQLRR